MHAAAGGTSTQGQGYKSDTHNDPWAPGARRRAGQGGSPTTQYSDSLGNIMMGGQVHNLSLVEIELCSSLTGKPTP